MPMACEVDFRALHPIKATKSFEAVHEMLAPAKMVVEEGVVQEEGEAVKEGSVEVTIMAAEVVMEAAYVQIMEPQEAAATSQISMR